MPYIPVNKKKKSSRVVSKKQAAEKELAIRELEKRYEKERTYFSNFVRTFFKLYYNKEFIWNWHYEEICNTLQDLFEGKIKLGIINVPPQSGKTELVTKLFPIWCMGRDPHFRTIATGYSASLTTTFSEQARNYYTSSAYTAIFPRAVALEKESADNWGTATSQYRSAGVGGSITGKSSDLFIIDDPLNPTDVNTSDTSMNKVNDWFSNVAVTRLSPTGRQMMLVIMQRLHDNDLCGYLQRKFKQRFEDGIWRNLIISAEVDKDGGYGSFFPKLFPLDDADNKLFNPDSPKYTLKERRNFMATEYGANYYAAQYLQDPVDIENAEFKRTYFRYFKEQELSKEGFKTIIAVDPAISERQTADRSAISVVSQDLEGNFYRRAYFAGRVSPDVLIDKIFELQSAFKCPVVVENISFQRILIANIRKMMPVKRQYFELREVGSRGEKVARIRSTLSNLYKLYKIYHEEGDKYSNFEEELLRFPKASHDDEIDAFEMAISQFTYSPKKQWSPHTTKTTKLFSRV